MEDQETKVAQTFEVEELNENDMSGVAGGAAEIEADGGTNVNCGCNGHVFNGSSSQSNENCGC